MTQYNMPWLYIDPESGCPHVCTITMRRTRYYSAMITTCPRGCSLPLVEIYWSNNAIHTEPPA